jgi:hypothetical protein
MPRRGRSRQADAFVARRRVGQGDERRYWKLEKDVSGEEADGERCGWREKQSDIEGQGMTLTGHDACVRDAIRCDATGSASAGVWVWVWVWVNELAAREGRHRLGQRKSCERALEKKRTSGLV